MGYVTKPFEPSRLVQIIHDLIRGEETRDRSEKASRTIDMVGKPAASS
jgi:hypothetical protein